MLCQQKGVLSGSDFYFSHHRKLPEICCFISRQWATFLRFRVSGGTGKLWELSAASGEEGTAVCGDRRKKIYGKRKGSGAD